MPSVTYCEECSCTSFRIEDDEIVCEGCGDVIGKFSVWRTDEPPKDGSIILGIWDRGKSSEYWDWCSWSKSFEIWTCDVENYHGENPDLWLSIPPLEE